jgi:NADH-quinone oxidoreductase subunit L
MNLLWLIPTLPFLGAFLLILLGSKLPKVVTTLIGIGSVGVSAAVTILVGIYFLSGTESLYHHIAWQWINTAGLTISFAFHLDALSLIFCFVITFVGFLIHIYSSEFMADDDGYARFFAYLNLFVSSMLILVLADNLMLLYLGWEGVGLCSYLLIGFWYKEEKNGYAARKAFIITRVGDTALAIGLFLLFQTFQTLSIQEISLTASQSWTTGSESALIVALLLLGGAVGKSAQLPLQTWLPDAMAGPSPVSALIHAATMVTAGVYLIARMHVIFELAPLAQFIVGTIGAITLLLAGFSALTQHDLKRILAYSTISQIGYMFLALGVGAWSAAIFHFMIHAFFKALLFLAAGAVIMAMHHEHDIFKMGGLKNKLPAIFWTFLIGSASLAALPLITSGFYSKDQILWLTWAGEQGTPWFFGAALLGAFITSIYTARMVFVTFFGEAKGHVTYIPGRIMIIPLLVLSGLSLIAGSIELPHTLGHITLFSDLLVPVLPETITRVGATSSEWIFQLIAGVVTITGIYIAYIFYLKNPSLADKLKNSNKQLHQLLLSGWGFDALYNTLIVKPFVWIAAKNKQDVIDSFYNFSITITQFIHRQFAYTQSGIMRWYIMGIVIGAIAVLTLSIMIKQA